jgi:hypothetical protein
MASKVNGDIHLGCVVQVVFKNIDTNKVDGRNLTLVVIKKLTPLSNASSNYRLACAKGSMQNLYSRDYINVVKDVCAKTFRLNTILSYWKGKASVTEQEAAASTSLVGGQGVKRHRCHGTCNTKCCTCIKEGCFCSSAWYGGMHHCYTNNEKIMPM